MADKRLVIVESPTKAKTITKFLGKDYTILASFGHIRDLPNNAAEIPEKYKKDKWAKTGINIEADFEPLYIIPPSKKDHVKKLKQALEGASELYLATDEDREGESISWHLLETLKPKIPVKRLVFHEITKEAINHALASPRSVDENLVKAQETRRIIDRLFGYEISPLLWKKIKPKLSAGRVQSVAIRLLVEREKSRMRFKKAVYWGIKAKFAKLPDGTDFEAELTHLNDKRVAIGKDFDAETGALSNDSDVALLSEKSALELRDRLLSSQAKVAQIEEKPFTSRPAPPFVTSTLQQEGNRKLRLSAKHTMMLAQRLYENGFITYMRTDSTTLSDEAINAARSFILKDYGNEYLPDQPRIYKTKVKNAQEAHEAIRPAGDKFTPPEVVRQQLGIDEFKLYELIWKRTVASQMSDARGKYTTAQIESGDAKFRASGKTIDFPGFLRAYVEGSDDPDSDLADQERILPKLTEGEKLKTSDLEAQEHSTNPPARYTEGSLIKELERLGIGRPSTWASIVEVVLQRNYAFKRGTALVPSFTAFGVVNLLGGHFNSLLDYSFTARLEDDLDAISRGEAGNLAYLKSFYFGNGHPGLKTLVKEGEEKIDPREVCGIALGKAADGRELEVRIGRYGPFLSDGTLRAGLSDSFAPDEVTIEEAERLLADAAKGPTTLGTHPETGLPIYVKKGIHGLYLQMGERTEDGDKPKTAGLLPNMTEADLNLELAVRLFALPRNLGKNPDNGEDILASNGPYGPYVRCATETRSLKADEHNLLELTLDQAVALLREPRTRGRGSKPAPLRELGKHTTSDLPLRILSGRFGVYLTDGEVNVTLNNIDPLTLSLEHAVSLIDQRAEKLRIEGKPVKKKRAAKPKAKADGAKEKKPATKAKAKKGGKKKAAAASPEVVEAAEAE